MGYFSWRIKPTSINWSFLTHRKGIRTMDFEGVDDERVVTWSPVLATPLRFERRLNGPEPFGLPLADGVI